MDKPMLGINLTVLYYFLPHGYVGNSLYRVLDKNKDGYLSVEEFTTGLSTLYFGELEQQIQFIFDMYDDDRDGYISCEDIRMMLSHIPIGTMMPQSKTKEGILTGSSIHSSYFDRIQVQKQIVELFKITLKDKQKINIEEFKKITISDSSDMFLCIFLVLRKKLPSMQNFLNFKSDYKMPFPPSDKKSSIVASPKMNRLSPSLEVLRVSPNMVHRSIICDSNPFLKYFKSRSIEIEQSKKIIGRSVPEELPKDINIPIMKTQPSTFLQKSSDEAVRMPNITVIEKNCKNTDAMQRVDYMESPTSFLTKSLSSQLGLCVCKCGRFCETGYTKCKECMKQNEIEGFLYVQLSEFKLKKYWYQLKGNELYSIFVIRV